MRPDNFKHQRGDSDEQRNIRRPFDSREIDSLPQATEQDPPYRPWWVVDAPLSEESDPPA